MDKTILQLVHDTETLKHTENERSSSDTVALLPAVCWAMRAKEATEGEVQNSYIKKR